MAPIRVGIIGLSASGRWASNAHLPYLRQSSRYSITALCNSSVEAAKAAIEAYELPSSTKAYGSPDDLAKDSDVDLVVCAVRVDKHYDTLKPSIMAGKDAFCEWPLAKNLTEAEELTSLAKENGSRTMVCLQAHHSPIFKKVKELVETGRIGKVLSTTFVGAAYNFGAAELGSLRYFNEKDRGGNMVTIHFSHSFYGVLFALGELKSCNSIIEVKRPTVQLLDKPGGNVVDTMTRTSHDQILIQGHLVSGALLSYHLRGGKPFENSLGLLWSIYGETGEIQVTAEGMNLQVGYPDAKIKLHDHSTGKVDTIEWQGSDVWDKLPLRGQNVARMYEAFAEGKDYPDWNEAIKRHRLVQELYDREEMGSESTTKYIRS